MPTLRAALSYAPEPVPTGAFRALAAIVSDDAESSERIELGKIADVELLLRVHALAEEAGTLVGNDAPSSSLALVVAPGRDTDDVLRALWRIGARDAFVLRD